MLGARPWDWVWVQNYLGNLNGSNRIYCDLPLHGIGLTSVSCCSESWCPRLSSAAKSRCFQKGVYKIFVFPRPKPLMYSFKLPRNLYLTFTLHSIWPSLHRILQYSQLLQNVLPSHIFPANSYSQVGENLIPASIPAEMPSSFFFHYRHLRVKPSCSDLLCSFICHSKCFIFFYFSCN